MKKEKNIKKDNLATEEWLRDIVSRASSMEERMSGPYECADSGGRDQVWKRWRELIAEGDDARFRERLSLDGWEEQDAYKMTGSVRLKEEHALPEWSSILAAVHARSPSVAGRWQNEKDCADREVLDREEPLPFEELILPFVYVGREKIKAATSGTEDLLTDAARLELERALLKKLSELSRRTLYCHFASRRHFSELGGEKEGSGSEKNRYFYYNFCQRFLKDGFIDFYQEYSVLARLMSVQTELWIEAVSEFYNRLKNDWDDLESTFSNEGNLGKVRGASPHLSDPHNRGRTVIRVEYENGPKLYYKPRPFKIDDAFKRLCQWIEQNGGPSTPHLPRTLSRPTHGWAEEIEHKPLSDSREAHEYYNHSGKLLCLLYILSGTDFHNENIIASGKCPVPVDLETLVTPLINPIRKETQTNVSKLAQQANSSVLMTAYLPRWRSTADGVQYDLSGIGGNGAHGESDRLNWKQVNTDQMTVEKGLQNEVDHLQNIPYTPEGKVRLEGYEDDVVEGFRSMYRFLRSKQAVLLEDDSPLHEFNRTYIRYVARHTSTYQRALHRATHPRYLRNGASWSIEVEALAKPLIETPANEKLWRMWQAERQALHRLDVPLFWNHPSSLRLEGEGYEVESFFDRSGFNRVISKVRNLSNENEEMQVELIRASFYAKSNKESHSDTETHRKKDLGDLEPLSSEDALTCASEISEKLQRRAVVEENGDTTWFSVVYDRDQSHYALQPINYDLYSGKAGIMLFLAALHHISGCAEAKSLLDDSISSFRKQLHSKNFQRNAYRHGMDIGGGSGWGAVVYALTQIGKFLKDDSFFEDAQTAARLLSVERIRDDDKHGAIEGAAGAALGLLKLHSVTEDDEVLERAMVCGEHLLESRSESREGFQVWEYADKHKYTGLAHGAAGQALALARLAVASGNPKFAEAAIEAISYIQSRFDRAAGGWLPWESTESGSAKPEHMWCHGAPGIGLAALGCSAAFESLRRKTAFQPEASAKNLDPKSAAARTRSMAATAVQEERSRGLSSKDHLCCGNFGRLELLISFSNFDSQDSSLLREARRRASAALSLAEQGENFSLGVGEDIYTPGFFTGEAGIGYMLLRVAYPKTLPAVLAWE